jgi:hypothetical protein
MIILAPDPTGSRSRSGTMDSSISSRIPIPGVGEGRTQVPAGGSAAHDAAVRVQHAAAQQARHPAVLAPGRSARSRRYGRL